MSDRRKLETILYHQKLAYNAWLNRGFLNGLPSFKEASTLVWELMVDYSEALEDFESASDNIYKTSYELAKVALRDISLDKVMTHYRDHLIDAMMDYVVDRCPEQYRTLVRFTNLLSSAICEAQADTMRREMRHRRTEILSQELKIAKQIQSHLLPRSIPTIPGFDFAGRLKPAAEIGGDYWSIKHQIKEELVTLKLADITGHGIAAATLVAAVKFISGGYYQGSSSASEVMERTNRVLTQDTPHEILVSMVYGWLRPSTYEITIVNAGHAPVFLCTDTICTDIPLTGPLMGLMENAEYEERKYKLNKGDLLFFGSDGIIEAGVGEQFGTNRLRKLVMGNKDRTADEIADIVVQAVGDFVKKPHDDISLVVVKVTGDAPSGRDSSML